MHALVRLKEDEEAVVARAAEHGLAVDGLGAYRAGTAGAGKGRGAEGLPALVIGYATPPEHAFTAAVARLGAALRTPPA